LEKTYSLINIVVVVVVIFGGGGGGGGAPAAAVPTVVNLSQLLLLLGIKILASCPRSSRFPATCPAVDYVLLEL